MRVPPVVLALVFSAGCATSGGVATLADGRSGTFPILTSTFPTMPGAVEQPGTVTGDLSLPGGSGRVPAGVVPPPCPRGPPPPGDRGPGGGPLGSPPPVVARLTPRGGQGSRTGA